MAYVSGLAILTFVAPQYYHYALYVEVEGGLKLILDFYKSGLVVTIDQQEIDTKKESYEKKGKVEKIEYREGLTWSTIRKAVESTETWRHGVLPGRKHCRDFVDHIEKHCNGKPEVIG